jgi:hypothetical protein
MDGKDSESALKYAQKHGETEIDPATKACNIERGVVISRVVTVAAEEEAGNYDDWKVCVYFCA